MKKVLSIVLAVVMILLAFTMIVSANHEHTPVNMRNGASHWTECSECYEILYAESHSFKYKHTPCTICGIFDESAPEVDSHDHEDVIRMLLESHYTECMICGTVKYAEPHNYMNDVCQVCTCKKATNPFVDVSDADWFCAEVIRAYCFGLVNGKNSTTTFLPNDYMTYAEAIKLAACMHELYTTGRVTLTNGNPWYQTYVDYCKRSNIIKREYNYNELVTREGYMEIFAAALPDNALMPINYIDDSFIPDVPSDNEYAPAIYKLYRAGILAGVDSAHNCNPKANIKRCEVAAIVSRMMDESQRIRFALFEIAEDSDVDGDDTNNDDETNPDDTNNNESTAPEEGGEQIEQKPTVDYEVNTDQYVYSELTIHKQPKGMEAEAYGGKCELEVQVFGGKAPYTYEWQYNEYRNNKVKIENGDYVKDVNTEALVLSIEKENTLLGAAISCVITDAEGTKVTTNSVKVYGPFSMKIDTMSIVQTMKKYTLVGRVDDGLLRKGEKVSVIRNGKVIAIGIPEDLQMFNKSMDETVKDDNVGIVFTIESGATPLNGDIVVKYLPSHVLDTSDIVN